MLNEWETRLNKPNCVDSVVNIYDTVIAGALDALGIVFMSFGVESILTIEFV
jgi:hypothetical protein